MEDKYLARIQYQDIVGVYKIIGETKLYHKIKVNEFSIAYVDKRTGKERGSDSFSITTYKLINKEEADKQKLRIRNFNTMMSFHYEDWKKVSAETLNKIILLLKEDGLCEAEK